MASISLLFAGVFAALSWLTPNHSTPWLSFHADFMMALALCVGLFGELLRRRPERDALSPLTVGTLAVAAIPMAQVAAGLIRFAGDGWMAAIYLSGFALAQVFGQRLANRWGIDRVAERLALVFLAASLASVGLQFYQWLSISGLGLLAAEMRPLGSPFANFAQQNHLATALVLGLASVLYLYERRRVSGAVTAAGVVFLEFGMAATGSRTAWLSVLMLTGALLLARRRLSLRIPKAGALGIGLAFVAMLVAWPAANDVLLLAPGRTLANQAVVGPRPLFYSSMADAVSRQPWFGYGWQQGLVAQTTVIDDHPAAGRLMGSSHNLVLDLLVWNGVPLALLITGLLCWWLVRQVRQCRSAAQLFLLLGIGAVLVHAMLEYPLNYAYFLLPVGMMMGLLDGATPTRWRIPVPRGALLAFAAIVTSLVAWVAAEYLRVEANTELLQLETARIGTHRIQSVAPELTLLTQWREYLKYARVEPHAGMSQQELGWMKSVVERFPYAAAMRHYAVANALNGHPDVAAATMARLCKLHNVIRCGNELQRWNEQARQEYPQLAAIELPPVPPPASPTPR